MRARRTRTGRLVRMRSHVINTERSIREAHIPAKMTTLVLLLLLAASQQLMAVSNCDCPEDVCSDSNVGVCSCAAECPFTTLESAMMRGENQYRLWTTFHNPREAFPQLVLVRYTLNNTVSDCSINLNCDTYMWTSNAFYFVVRPQVFGLLSLFLGILDDDHTGCINLTIPEECACWLYYYQEDDSAAVLNYLEVLTEKVCCQWDIIIMGFILCY